MTDKEGIEDIIIPAVPGFQLITFWMEDDEDPNRERDSRTFDIAAHLDRATVIAWRLHPGRYPEPLVVWATLGDEDHRTETGISRTGSITAIRDPAGTVVMQNDWSWRNIDEWIAHVREEWRKWRLEHPLPPAPTLFPAPKERQEP